MGMLERLLAGKVALRTVLEPGLAIHGDKSMVEQVLINLVVNANDAMTQGGDLTIEAKRVDGPPPSVDSASDQRQEYICLTVSDTGMGMDDDALERIFEPYFTTKAIGKGTGLGLSIVYGIVRQHDGWVKVDSKPGEGTTFAVYFPAAPATEPQDKETLPQIDTGGDETVLVVEDEPKIRRLLRRILEMDGYNVHTAESGPEALRTLDALDEKVSLLFTDLLLGPDMTGYELADEALRRFPDLRVIFSSGFKSNRPKNSPKLIRGENFLAKPYGIDEVRETVRRILDAPNT